MDLSGDLFQMYVPYGIIVRIYDMVGDIKNTRASCFQNKGWLVSNRKYMGIRCVGRGES